MNEVAKIIKIYKKQKTWSMYVFLKHEANIGYVVLKNKKAIDCVALEHEVNIFSAKDFYDNLL